MIKNHNGIAELSIHIDGNKVAVVYRPVTDEVIVAKGSTVGEALTMMADGVSGYPVEIDYPDHINLESSISDKPTTSIERYNEPANPELSFDGPPDPPTRR